MSWALFQLGAKRPPRTARRRLAWIIVTVPTFAAVAAVLVRGAVQEWTLLAAGGEDASIWSAMLLSILGLLAAFSVIGTAIIGAARYREQRAEERAQSVREA